MGYYPKYTPNSRGDISNICGAKAK